jgi:hypothetical protein
MTQKGMVYCSRDCSPFASLSGREDKKRKTYDSVGLSIDEITQFQKRAHYVAKKNGRPELAEDFAQEVLLAVTQGRRATVDQLFVDYLREQFGSSRNPGGRARQMAGRRTVSLDEEVGEEGSSILRHELIGGTERDLPSLGDRGRSAHLFAGIEADIYQMIFVEEQTLDQVGDHFGVSESRISQRVNSMRTRIRDHFLSERLLERYRDDESFGVLEVQWLVM